VKRQDGGNWPSTLLHHWPSTLLHHFLADGFFSRLRLVYAPSPAPKGVVGHVNAQDFKKRKKRDRDAACVGRRDLSQPVSSSIHHHFLSFFTATPPVYPSQPQPPAPRLANPLPAELHVKNEKRKERREEDGGIAVFRPARGGSLVGGGRRRLRGRGVAEWGGGPGLGGRAGGACASPPSIPLNPRRLPLSILSPAVSPSIHPSTFSFAFSRPHLPPAPLHTHPPLPHAPPVRHQVDVVHGVDV
jgi:hypothetical protein